MDDCSTWCNKEEARVGSLEKNVWKSMPLYIEEIFFFVHTSVIIIRICHPVRFPLPPSKTVLHFPGHAQHYKKQGGAE